jgi:hypothetical protein
MPTRVPYGAQDEVEADHCTLVPPVVVRTTKLPSTPHPDSHPLKDLHWSGPLD